MLNKSLCSLDYHLWNSLVIFRKFVKCGVDNINIVSHDRLFYISNFLRSFIYKKNNKVHFRIVCLYSLCNLLKKCCLSCLWLRNYHSTLSLADRSNYIHHSCWDSRTVRLKSYLFIWKDRCELFKLWSCQKIFYRITIYSNNIQQCRKFLTLASDFQISLKNISRAESVFLYECMRYINIIITRQEIVASDKSVTLCHYLKDSLSWLTAVKLT